MAWLLEDLRKLEIVYAKKKGNAWLLALIRVSLSLSKRKRLKWNKGDEITQVSLPKYMKYKNKRYLNYILLSSFLEKDFLLDCSLYETNISPPNPLITSTNSASLYKIQRISRKQWRIYIVKITRENRLLLVISPCAAVEQAFNNPHLGLHPRYSACSFRARISRAWRGGCAGEEVGAQQGVGKKTDCRYPRAALNSDNGMTWSWRQLRLAEVSRPFYRAGINWPRGLRHSQRLPNTLRE